MEDENQNKQWEGKRIVAKNERRGFRITGVNLHNREDTRNLKNIKKVPEIFLFISGNGFAYGYCKPGKVEKQRKRVGGEKRGKKKNKEYRKRSEIK